MTTTDRLGVAVVGAGYWGPNLVRNFRAAPTGTWSRCATWTSSAPGGRRRRRSEVLCTASLEEVLARDDVDAVAIATPARTHQGIALAALRAGKHVLVEKPLADTVEPRPRDGRGGPRGAAWS